MVAVGLDSWLNDFYDGNSPKKALWDDTFQSLYMASGKGTGIDLTKVRYNSGDFSLITSLIKDAGRFSAYKDNEIFYNLAQMANATPSPEAFKALAMPLLQKYKGYTEVEYDSALATSAMAKKWQGFADNSQLYPNLQYRAVMDNRTRDEHAKINGLILPLNHPFWQTNYPPNGYGCRCSVVQTDKPSAEKVPNSVADKGFDFNPGIEKRLFAESAGYYKAPNKKAVDDIARNFLSKISRDGARAKVSEVGALVFKKHKNVEMSQTDINTITGKNQKDNFLRNSLLFDIKNVCKEAEFIKSANDDGSHPAVLLWHYYKVMGYDNMYLNVMEMKNTHKLKLHAITDFIK